MLGTHSLNSILGLDSKTRLPSMITSINEIYGTSGTSVSIEDGSSISNVMSQRMYLLNKHREFSIILSIHNLYLITEVFQNGNKLNIKLPEVLASRMTKKDPRDLLMSKRAIFIYRGEEDDDYKKEICIAYSFVPGDYERVNKIMCYQYGTWKVTRGPFEFVFNFQLSYKEQLSIYQATNSRVLVMYDSLNFVIIDAELTKVVKTFY
jgi:hypothetical protein